MTRCRGFERGFQAYFPSKLYSRNHRKRLTSRRCISHLELARRPLYFNSDRFGVVFVGSTYERSLAKIYHDSKGKGGMLQNLTRTNYHVSLAAHSYVDSGPKPTSVCISRTALDFLSAFEDIFGNIVKNRLSMIMDDF
jgi:hypothetical protein